MDRRILLLLTDLKIGGTPTVVREIATRLHDPPRVTVTVACLDRRGPVADQIEQRGITVATLDAKSTRDLTIGRRLSKLIEERGIDTVLSFLLHANAVAAWEAKSLASTRFFQSIQTTQPRPRWHWFVQRWAQRRAEKIIVPSPSVAAVAREWAKVPADKIVVIPNGVDLPGAQPAPAPICSPRRVVFIGRLDPIKRLPDLLSAIASLNGFARLDIYGEGSERARLARQIDAMGIAPLVTLHGSIPQAAGVLNTAEVLVLPSQAEGFGLVLIEAMGAGVPVVATDAPGIRDVVRNGQTGLLVPVGSPSQLAAAIRRVLEDQTLRRALTAAAFEDVRRRFTWEIAMAEYHRLLAI